MLGLKAEVHTLTGRLDEACNALTAAEDHRYALTVAAENAERALSEKEADLARLTGELNERSTFADIQAKELVALKAYVGAIKERLDAADNELSFGLRSTAPTATGRGSRTSSPPRSGRRTCSRLASSRTALLPHDCRSRHRVGRAAIFAEDRLLSASVCFTTKAATMRTAAKPT
jgi:hypothetical protein